MYSSLLLYSIFNLPGIASLYDSGPPGSSLQANIITEWHKHFIIEDHMLEIDSTIMMPAPVFEMSGHVTRFVDWMVKDTKTGDILCADHLVKGVLEACLAGDREAGMSREDEELGARSCVNDEDEWSENDFCQVEYD